jgi:hypothetical protein
MCGVREAMELRSGTNKRAGSHRRIAQLSNQVVLSPQFGKSVRRWTGPQSSEKFGVAECFLAVAPSGGVTCRRSRGVSGNALL